MARIGIIGAGFGGLAMAIKGIEAGHEVTVFEKSDELGGTWSANTYPGAECDIPSALYSYSYEPSAEWPNKWSHQPVILDYLRHCAERYGVTPLIRFDTAVTAAHWDGTSWRVTADHRGVTQTCEFDVVVSATGQLSRPRIPDLEGLDSFAGACFHSARWDHGVELTDRRVAVIGNAASATQFVPEIAPDAAHVTVFQRSANWMIAKHDKDYSERWKRLLRRYPMLGKVPRFWIWFRADFLLFPLMRRSTRLRSLAEKRALDDMHEVIDDEELRAMLTPDYPMGARRILFSDTYYAALAEHDHLELETTPIARISPTGVVTEDGVEHPADVLVLATGFETSDYLTPIRVTTDDGRCLNDEWCTGGAEAYYGTAVNGYPNLFFLYGPNTNLGHSSIVFMMECQVRLILGLLDAAEGRPVEVTADAQARYNREMQRRLGASIWGTVDASWYLTDGKITQNWPGRTLEFWRRTRRPRLADFGLASSRHDLLRRGGAR